MLNSMIQFETSASSPIRIGDKSITLYARTLQLKFPKSTGGLVWNRPVSVRVQNADGTEQALPVRDVTRRVQWTLMGVGALFLLIAVRKGKNRKLTLR